MKFSKELHIKKTPIPGVLLCELPVHGDNRGWFKENWQREKMLSLGLPDFNPVQNNISFNTKKGTTRGIHAEPWDKFISVATGSVFGAWVDLREGPSFGHTFTTILDPSTAIFIPQGVGNAFQTLEENTAYTYLVNDHWSVNAQNRYTFLNLADKKANITWPIDLATAEISEKDQHHPYFKDVKPTSGRKKLILGSSGQLGQALQEILPEAECATRDKIDLANVESLHQVQWEKYDTIINAGAYTAVDLAQTQGHQECWATNATAVGELARIATEKRLTLVHISSDYVFDGTKEIHHESEPLSPLSVYGSSKAAGDIAAATTTKHYILRTSWVIGQGRNFIATMAELAQKGVSPSVVNDQFGRLSFASDIAGAVVHLLETNADYGLYNISNEGPTHSWAQLARIVFKQLGYDPEKVTGISTDEYFSGKKAAPRPLNSTLDLQKIKATGFAISTQQQRLKSYLESITSKPSL